MGYSWLETTEGSRIRYPHQVSVSGAECGVLCRYRNAFQCEGNKTDRSVAVVFIREPNDRRSCIAFPLLTYVPTLSTTKMIYQMEKRKQRIWRASNSRSFYSKTVSHRDNISSRQTDKKKEKEKAPEEEYVDLVAVIIDPPGDQSTPSIFSGLILVLAFLS